MVRNRIKRQVREFFRMHAQALPSVDLNVIVRRRAADLDGGALRQELSRIFARIGSN